MVRIVIVLRMRSRCINVSNSHNTRVNECQCVKVCSETSQHEWPIEPVSVFARKRKCVSTVGTSVHTLFVPVCVGM